MYKAGTCVCVCVLFPIGSCNCLIVSQKNVQRRG